MQVRDFVPIQAFVPLSTLGEQFGRHAKNGNTRPFPAQNPLDLAPFWDNTTGGAARVQCLGLTAKVSAVIQGSLVLVSGSHRRTVAESLCGPSSNTM